MHKALQNRSINKEIVQFLLEQGANVKAKNKNQRTVGGGNTPLHIALANKNITLKVVELLLNKDASVLGVKNHIDETPLTVAAWNKAMTPEIIELLLAKRSGTLDKNIYDDRTVYMAANCGNRAVFDLLFQKAGIGVNTRYKYTFLELASLMNNIEVIESLLNIPGIDANPIDYHAREKQTLLHSMVVSTVRSAEVVELFVKAATNIDVQDGQGNSPLHLAVKQYIDYLNKPCGLVERSLSTIAILLNYGANKNLPNKDGVTPLQLVTNSTNKELRELLDI